LISAQPGMNTVDLKETALPANGRTAIPLEPITGLQYRWERPDPQASLWPKLMPLRRRGRKTPARNWGRQSCTMGPRRITLRVNDSVLPRAGVSLLRCSRRDLLAGEAFSN